MQSIIIYTEIKYVTRIFCMIMINHEQIRVFNKIVWIQC